MPYIYIYMLYVRNGCTGDAIEVEVVCFGCSMPQAPHEAHRRRVRAICAEKWRGADRMALIVAIILIVIIAIVLIVIVAIRLIVILMISPALLALNLRQDPSRNVLVVLASPCICSCVYKHLSATAVRNCRTGDAVEVEDPYERHESLLNSMFKNDRKPSLRAQPVLNTRSASHLSAASVRLVMSVLYGESATSAAASYELSTLDFWETNYGGNSTP